MGQITATVGAERTARSKNDGGSQLRVSRPLLLASISHYGRRHEWFCRTVCHTTHCECYRVASDLSSSQAKGR